MTWFSIAIRWLLGIGLLGFGFSLLANELGGDGDLSDHLELPLHEARRGISLKHLGIGAGSIIVGILVIAPDIVRLAASPFLAFIDSIFLPGQRGGKPELNLRLPAFYREKERYDDALAEYRKIIRYYPKEPEGWIGAIELLAETFDEKEEARKLYARARRKLRENPDALVEVESRWHRLANEFDL